MTTPVFNPPIPPSPGTEDKPEFKLLEADFGDGYTQTAPEGLNHIRRVLSLSWDLLTPSQAREITAFLFARGGYQAFFYTPSDEEDPVLWTCKDYSDKRGDNGFRTVTATFKQSHNTLG